MKYLPRGERGGAEFSSCRAYRYKLWRLWSDAPKAVFVCLNPSTADSSHDDATLRKVMGFSRIWGCGGVVVVNLFALRATDPKVMLAHPEPVGPTNDAHIRHALTYFGPVSRCVPAWGTHGTHMGRDAAVWAILDGMGVKCETLGLTKGGHPRHPLYMPYPKEG